MKKTLLIIIAFMATTFIYAQSGSMDVKSLALQIMEKLTPALSLTAEQKPNVNETIIGFLSKKAEIIHLQKSDPAGYTSKFNLLSGDLINKLKDVVSAKQMGNFLGLRPKVNTPSDVLSQLFF